MNTAQLELPREIIAGICNRYKVRELSVFGSAVTGDFTAESDIDMLVEFDPEAQTGLIDFIGMQMELSEALNRKVDLVSKRGLNPFIRDDILYGAKVLYAA